MIAGAESGMTVIWGKSGTSEELYIQVSKGHLGLDSFEDDAFGGLEPI